MRLLSMPADGTTTWNSRYGCDYTVVNRLWSGKFCAAYQSNSDGTANHDLVNVYAYDSGTTDRVGFLRYQLDVADPNWIEWRVPSDPAFQTVLWEAVPRSNPTAEPNFWVDLGGVWQWTTQSAMIALIQRLEQEIQAEGVSAPASTDIVTVGGTAESASSFTDLVNGVDTLGGNAQLGATFSNIYSLAVSDPVDMGICGEGVVWQCSTP